MNNQYLDDQRKLADATALRRSLLTQLAAATTTGAIDSLKRQISDAESTIATDEASVNRLQGQISLSTVGVTISAGDAVNPSSPQTPAHHGFTLARAAHDALDVLKVAAGVALIALAVLVPVGLATAVILWIRSGWRRLARERALDAG